MQRSDLVTLLIAAQRSGVAAVDQAAFADLSRPDAYDVQREVAEALGATPGLFKTAIHPDGVGVAAPIFAAHVGRSGAARLPLSGIAGLEVEIGVVLARDVASAGDLPAAIDHLFLGVEVCGTRLLDRKAATPFVGLADNMSAFGYVIGARWTGPEAVDGLEVELTVASTRIYRAPAKHGFGSVLGSLRAYADHQVPHLPLQAGAIVTTGSLCGLVPVTAKGPVVARLADQTVDFEISE